ncbi:N-acetylmuramoyl-L-alanine amidase [Anabaena sp. UHCC 0187]|uniref:N-acetylmuramoyl-L-alanine amidase family protein n=1 Tax=Anabaena sp. UHCC 0187 TaxID=2590018 RepID=UPI00352A16D3
MWYTVANTPYEFTILYHSKVQLKSKIFNQLGRLSGFLLLVFLSSPSPVLATVESLPRLKQVGDYQKIGNKYKPLSGIKILVNPGHGGKETGAAGFTGFLAKDANLIVSKFLRTELQKRGAIVVMSREEDREISLLERQRIINQVEPKITITIHYTAIEIDGDAEKTQGVRSFWYHPQSHSLANIIHHYLVNKLGRKSQGVYWNNLALTRPEIAPSVVLELGFMTHPQEFEWIVNPQEQKKLAVILAESIVEWFRQYQH